MKIPFHLFYDIFAYCLLLFLFVVIKEMLSNILDKVPRGKYQEGEFDYLRTLHDMSFFCFSNPG